MNSLFGDATTIAPTPETLAEAESLFSGNRSPSSFRLGDQGDDVPDMDLQPPDVDIQDGKPILNERGEGVGGWISNVVKRAKGEDPNSNGGGSGKYKRVGQDDD
jgi:hypothetical protein